MSKDSKSDYYISEIKKDIENNKFESALGLLFKLFEIGKNEHKIESGYVQFQIAQCYYGLNKIIESVEYIKKSILLDPFNPQYDSFVGDLVESVNLRINDLHTQIWNNKNESKITDIEITTEFNSLCDLLFNSDSLLSSLPLRFVTMCMHGKTEDLGRIKQMVLDLEKIYPQNGYTSELLNHLKNKSV
jgi:tetratricopeptide (TPR) repeat protein